MQSTIAKKQTEASTHAHKHMRAVNAPQVPADQGEAILVELWNVDWGDLASRCAIVFGFDSNHKRVVRRVHS